MPQVEIRKFQENDFTVLGGLFHSVPLNENRVFWWVGDEDNWENVFCAFENNQMIAKGQVAVVNTIPSGSPSNSKHTIFLNLKTLPEKENDIRLINEMYEHLLIRAKQLKQTLSGEYCTLLCVGNFSNEVRNNQYFIQNQGFRHLISKYSMKRDLSKPITEVELEKPLNFDHWQMESPDEASDYLELQAEIWSDEPLGLERLNQFKQNQLWTTMIVRRERTVIGSTMVWQEDKDMGFLENVFVKPEWRNCGYARYLVTQALIYLRNNHLSYAQLMVDETNTAAICLYESAGFEIESLEIRYCIEL